MGANKWLISAKTGTFTDSFRFDVEVQNLGGVAASIRHQVQSDIRAGGEAVVADGTIILSHRIDARLSRELTIMCS